MTHIPVIDFVDYQQDTVTDTANTVATHNVIPKQLGEELKAAFETVGFCYIKNHGIGEEVVQKYFEASRNFFCQSLDVKRKYSRENSEMNFGWVAEGTEQVTPDRPPGVRESFNFYPPGCPDNWGKDVIEFKDASLLMVDQCRQLAHRILNVLNVGLGLEENFFRDCHKLLGQNDNFTCLKSLFYPPILDDSLIKPGQIRMGEHSDFGSMTILFQDDIGGLEVEIPDVGFVPATPIPGTVVVNIGDLMQRWTADKLIATKHRVLIPEKEMMKRSCRQSMAFFIHPDDDVIIKCLDGSRKYEPITSLDYMKERFSAIY